MTTERQGPYARHFLDANQQSVVVQVVSPDEWRKNLPHAKWRVKALVGILGTLLASSLAAAITLIGK